MGAWIEMLRSALLIDYLEKSHPTMSAWIEIVLDVPTY